MGGISFCIHGVITSVVGNLLAKVRDDEDPTNVLRTELGYSEMKD